MCTEVSVASCDFHKHFVKQQIKWILKKKKKKSGYYCPRFTGAKRGEGISPRSELEGPESSSLYQDKSQGLRKAGRV